MTKEELSTKGKRAARTVLYARALLLLDVGEHGQRWIVSKVSEALGTSTRSLEKLKKQFVEEGLWAAMMHLFFKTSKTSLLITPDYDTFGDSLSPLESESLFA